MYYVLVYYLKNRVNDLMRIREQYDPNAHCIKPHMTLVFPIDAFQIDEAALIDHIDGKTQNYKSFSLQFIGFEKSWDNYLFLTTGNGTKEVITLHDGFYIGILEKFLNKDIIYIPHVTLGVFQTDLQKYNRALEKVTSLNFNTTELCDKITLIKFQDKFSSAQTVKEFYLQ